MKAQTIISVCATLFGIVRAGPIDSCDVVPATPSVKVSSGTVIGSLVDDVEYFRGIPYAKPPIGPLRLRPPKPIKGFGTIQATGVGPSCPQFTVSESSPVFNHVAGLSNVMEAIAFAGALGNETEDCLTVSVMRPQNTKSHEKLPILLWMHGGGFQMGSAQPYNASVLIPKAVSQGKPFILVGVNYRLGGFGFLGGKEVLADGVANLGLLDQRLALEWVADNIAAFGGDPDAVTIWGESAGAMSVFSQMALYDGNNKYKGRPLFRGAIMNSGSLTPAEPVDGVKAQEIFDIVVREAGCGAVPAGFKSTTLHDTFVNMAWIWMLTNNFDVEWVEMDPLWKWIHIVEFVEWKPTSSNNDKEKLDCLRGLDYETFLNATTKVPSYLGYHGIALSYYPRPDGRIITASAEILARKKKYAAVPMIIGNQENEGTMFGIFSYNLTTKANTISYLNDIFFRSATRKQVSGLVDKYPRCSACDTLNATISDTYPEFRRLAAILGDYQFILMSRIFLDYAPESVPAWSYIASYAQDTPILGTWHTADLPRMFYKTDEASSGIQDRYIAFVNSLDPNDGLADAADDAFTRWPSWHDSRQLIDFRANSTGLLDGDFRSNSFNYIRKNLESFRV
ncbi:hypothetical protein FOXG_22198 [Fusarium oxysporum f. sp. lycopersici 4287]|uniref:Carboxylic ester hydrolase n=2 Tax=Fusarium oxysporum TaxID=5507 RepID=A0A0J9W634_FUSO4|nr:uncharacterized protein FOXG_22198 [Fusarium oxysporum f. sp. lycopersici 4287]KAJ9419876.1 Alpha/Beta hydrolase protein [Fusarium oxysporum]KNB18343.1 hypothetical protein FOXG_22198 [Fusarium oxysporum f. sp. lycopersici 4287]